MRCEPMWWSVAFLVVDVVVHVREGKLESGPVVAECQRLWGKDSLGSTCYVSVDFRKAQGPACCWLSQ